MIQRALWSASLLLALACIPALAQEGERMSYVARGSFTVEMTPEAEPDAAEGVELGRMALAKRFDGDLVGSSAGRMLTAMTPVPGSAGYVAIERVTGTLNGRTGSFVLQHSGTMHRGERELSITIVPESGTGQLAGVEGVFKLSIVDGDHQYSLEYTLPE